MLSFSKTEAITCFVNGLGTFDFDSDFLKQELSWPIIHL